MPRTLITGGAGFIGSHLCDYFLAQGHEVISMDNLLTGDVSNIAHIRNQQFLFIKHDVTNYIYVEGKLDYLLHFASPASPIDYEKLPIQTLKVGSLGTHKALGLAKEKRATFLLASTSEVYGDPLVHPQSEEYWGNVNPVGPRGVYDEAKRFAEAMTMAYHRVHEVDTRIVRIFNSIMADETVVLFHDDAMYVEPVETYVDSHIQSPLIVPRRIYVPAFNPETFKVELRLANALIKHPAYQKDAYLIRTRYGRQIKVTGDHSVFRRNTRGQPEAVPVRELNVGDYIAIPAYLPVVEKDVTQVNIAEHLIQTATSDEQLWKYALISPQLVPAIEAQKDLICELLMQSARFPKSQSRRNTVGCAWRKYRREGMLPLWVVSALWRRGLWKWPDDALIRLYKGGGGTVVCNTLPVSDDLLWLLGLYVAEGCHVANQGDYRLILTSDTRFVQRALHILKAHFGVQPHFLGHTVARGPSLYVNSQLLLYVFQNIFQVTGASKSIRIPGWIMQLPLSRLKYFLEGYREGDGTHTNYFEKRELAFNTVSKGLATDLTYLLLRFGIVASLGHYESTFKRRYGDRRFPFSRVTVCEVSNFDILAWDQGVTQRLQARRLGDLVWVPIRSITPIEATAYVYDFSVEGFENFVAGTGVFAHNTFGPRMRLEDGRAIPTFIRQALLGEDITVFGDGSQTRSFCYVSDLVEGIYRVLMSGEIRPVNLGNPQELTILQLADAIIRLTGSRSKIIFTPLPQDDPKVRRPDITRVRQLSGWEPRVGFEEGLAKTVSYFRDKLGLHTPSPG